ncbi:MAG: hypothetical protein KDK70_23980, partial [Myxococcales bacterium]|nr:hypothetical protein [Myxococcales bacterium]
MEDRETLAYGPVGDVFVIILRGDQTHEPEWRACMLEAMRTKGLSRVLLVPGDALPDVGQRHDLVELHEKHALRLAVLSDLTATDRVVTALRWGGMEAEGFGTDDLDGMLAFLDRPYVRARMSSVLGPYL